MSRALAPRRRRATRRGTRLAFAVAILAALVLATSFVWHSAYALFTVATYPVPVPVGTARLVLADNDADTALFAATDLRPGATATRCLVVTSASTVPTTVKVYRTSRTSNALSGALRITVDGGTGGCAAFVSAGSPDTTTLSAFPTSYAAGLGAWATTGANGESRTYQVTYSLPTDATTNAQGGTASLALTWETQTP